MLERVFFLSFYFSFSRSLYVCVCSLLTTAALVYVKLTTLAHKLTTSTLKTTSEERETTTTLQVQAAKAS